MITRRASTKNLILSVVSVNSSLPVHLTPSNVQENPEFAKLLTSLTRHLTDGGMSLAVHKDMTQVGVTGRTFFGLDLAILKGTV